MSLQFNSDSNNQDIVSEALAICNTTTNVYSVNAITRRANFALDRFCYLAMTASASWGYEDLTYNDLPIGTTNLYSGQQDYSFAGDVLEVDKVLIKDPNGEWKELTPVTMPEASKDAPGIWTLPTTNSGVPVRYQKFANSLLLDPIPNYNSSTGLKVVFRRGPSYFEFDDTVKRAGVPTIFYGYICRMIALPFLIEHQLPAKNDVSVQIQLDERAIRDYYAMRQRDIRPRMSVRVESTR